MRRLEDRDREGRMSAPCTCHRPHGARPQDPDDERASACFHRGPGRHARPTAGRTSPRRPSRLGGRPASYRVRSPLPLSHGKARVRSSCSAADDVRRYCGGRPDFWSILRTRKLAVVGLGALVNTSEPVWGGSSLATSTQSAPRRPFHLCGAPHNRLYVVRAVML